ncbi:hypothetical protein [Neobacillus kokaensis]|uniref:SPOR domain-containing protein n=1 Tax=Neobacillus kokaensis TaxID=2759023 RepID=A0ABQ3N0U7_9BACI|nr:hypothetical protein [Neobacillus kokaensis]GHH97182.1 hypothetical protein AM1BK_07250 [Neobacillus kokaensis]
MDRPKKGNTITIKINGDNRTYQEELHKAETEENTVQNPPIVELHPEQIEEEAMLETAAAQENEDESFDWIIPDSLENEVEEMKAPSSKGKGKGPHKTTGKKTVSFSSYYKKKNGKPVSSILITAVFAVLIGTTIGVFMLKLLNGTPAEKVVTDPVTIEEPKTDNPKQSMVNTASAEINQQTAFVIQGGVFGSKDGAAEISDKLASIGVPSEIIEIDNNFYLFLGVADSIESAKSLGAQYKQNGVEDVFAKPLLIDEKTISGLSSNEKNFLEAVPTIYETLSLVTSSALLTNELPAEGASSLAVIEKQLNDSGIKNKKVTSLKTALQGAQEKVRNFEASKDPKSLTEAQQHLLNFLAVYYWL